jgi:pimeloyl-ACP methyl ester carboxylesterase
VTVGGLAFRRFGQGEPLVLIHGIGHHWRAWEPVIADLATTNDVYAIDLPGFGRSPAPDRVPTGMPGLVDAVGAFFAEAGLDRPHVAGNSLGGAIALELAAHDRVRSATALSPAGFAGPGEIRMALTVLGSLRAATFSPTPALRALYRTKAGRWLAFGRLVVDPQRLSAERVLDDTLALRRGKGFRPVARAARGYAFEKCDFAVPVTVAWGAEDAILPYRQAARARDLLPGANHVDLTGCGHVPMSDDPQQVTDVIRATMSAATTWGK